jgi:O-antigen ligase
MVVSIRRSPGSSLVLAGLIVAMAITPAIFDPNIYDNFTLPKQASLMVATALVLTGLALEGHFLPGDRWLRAAVLIWIGWTTLAFLAGIDRRGSIFGVYQYRQGYVTFLAYAALFLGAISATRRSHERWLFVAGIAGFAGVTAYTAIQSVGLDPVHWWVDTSARAIGTIGNANELASYAVLAVGFAGAGVLLRPRYRFALVAVLAAATTYVVLQSESRSGLAACIVVMVLFPVTAAIRGQAKRSILLQWSVLAAGGAIAMGLSLFTGGVGGTADRVQTAIAAADTTATQNVTRVQLWRGTAPVIMASPLWGFGPDALQLAFPRYRPADLGGAFASYDLAVQSSHNLLLDTAAATGLVGLVALVSVVGIAGYRSLRTPRTQGPDALPYLWSSMGGYLGLALLNPLSLASHATFFVLLGILAGRTAVTAPEPRLAAQRLLGPVRLLAVLPAALTLCVAAGILRVADSRAEAGWGDYSSGHFADASDHYGDAASLMPLEHRYARAVADTWLAEGASGNRTALARAEQAYEGIQTDFVLTSTDAMGLATARIGLQRPAGEIMPVIDTMVETNPHGITTASYSATLRKAAVNGGTLHFTVTDLWVSVTPNDSP